MPRSKNLEVLTQVVKTRWPGVVIYGIGDSAHRQTANDHNEDDTPGVRAAQTDADNLPEHRAVDIMIGPNFKNADADALVASLVTNPDSRRRLFYVIWNRRIWSRDSGWAARTQQGDPHTDHVHVSGLAADDGNTGIWNIAGEAQEDDMLSEVITIDKDIADLSAGYVKAGQKIVLGRFLQLMFSHNERDLREGLANRAALVTVNGKLDTLTTAVTELKSVLSKGGGDVNVAAIVKKLEEESTKTREFASELLKTDEASEKKHAKAMAAAWNASLVE